jgi:formamidopyrimidine-DNA glycosylase
MPELPDVETFRRYVDATSLHQKIAAVDIDAPRMLQGVSKKRLISALTGKAFRETARHGKFLFVRFDSAAWLVLHFGMTGYLDYFKGKGDLAAEPRLQIHFTNDHHLAGVWQRRLGRIGLAEAPAAFAEQEGLGPDALDPAIDVETFGDMFRRKGGSVKSALMDQAFLAGIGNIYSDEMLFQAGLDPRHRAKSLDDGQLADLHRAMLHVLKVAIDRQADPGRMPDSWLLPARDKDGTCPRCGGPLERIKVAGRTAWLCPECQH